MQQIGIVTEVNDDGTARIQIKRASACGENCGQCGGCNLTSVKVDVLNQISAKTGQTVKIEMKDSSILRAAFLVYIAPLIILFISYAIAFKITDSELISVMISIAFLIISFVLLRVLDTRIRKSKIYQNKIIDILQ